MDNKSQLNIIQFTEKFQKVEMDYGFFNYRDNEKHSCWDILRFAAFKKIFYEQDNQRNILQQLNSIKKSRIKKTIQVIKYYWHTNWKSYDYIFFICSRNKYSETLNFDASSYDFLENINGKHLIFESYQNAEAYLHKGIIDYGLSHHKLILSFFNTINLNKEHVDFIHYLNSTLTHEFNLSYSLENYFLNLSKIFYYEYKYYLKLFSKIQPKRIFIVQNGIQKALFAAANTNKIPCSELQHGLISFIHPAYSYPANIPKETLNTLPESFFTFSEFWTQNLYFPVKEIIPIGNTHFAKKIEKKNTVYQITVIFADIYTEILSDFIDKLLQRGYSENICLKLHSNQFNALTDLTKKYSNYPNVTVISNQLNIEEILAISNAILAIQSTVVYQALHNNVKVYIYKKLDYETHEDVFENPLVTLVESHDKFNSIPNVDASKYLTNYHYFNKFDNKLLP